MEKSHENFNLGEMVPLPKEKQSGYLKACFFWKKKKKISLGGSASRKNKVRLLGIERKVNIWVET